MAGDYEELKAVLQELLTNRFAPKPEYTRGLLGDGQGNVIVANNPDRNYARFNRGATEYFEIFNVTVPPVDGWPILIGELPWLPGLTQVVGTDWAAYEQSGWGDSISSTSPHAPTHEWPNGSPGADPVSVYLRSIVPLRGYALGTGSTTFYANSYEYENANGSGSVWGGLPGVDLQPVMASLSTGTAKLMGVYLDPVTNTLAVVTGTTDIFTDASDPPAPSFPSSSIPVARVRVYGGQSSIGEVDIRDARRPFGVSGAGAGGVYPFDIITVDAVDLSANYNNLADAITASAAGGTIKIGPGTYDCTELSPAENTYIIGSGKGVTILNTTGSKGLDMTTGGLLADLTIQSSAESAFSYALYAKGAVINVEVLHTGSLATSRAITSSATVDLIDVHAASDNGLALYGYTANGIIHIYDGKYVGTVEADTTSTIIYKTIPTIDGTQTETSGGTIEGDYTGVTGSIAGVLRSSGLVTGSVSQAQSFGSNGIEADVIAESTAAAGVTADGVLLKDGDAYLKDDAAGVKQRFVYNFKTTDATEDFDAAVGAAWSYAGSPFDNTTTPTITQSHLSFSYTSSPNRTFLYRTSSVPTTAQYGQFELYSNNVGDYIGLRMDDGTDSYYVQAVLRYKATNQYEWASIYKNGGSEVVTSHKTLEYPIPLIVMLRRSGASWASWAGFTEMTLLSKEGFPQSFGSGFAWTPTRVGIVTLHQSTASWRQYRCDWWIGG